MRILKEWSLGQQCQLYLGISMKCPQSNFAFNTKIPQVHKGGAEHWLKGPSVLFGCTSKHYHSPVKFGFNIWIIGPHLIAFDSEVLCTRTQRFCSLKMRLKLLARHCVCQLLASIFSVLQSSSGSISTSALMCLCFFSFLKQPLDNSYQ